MNVRFMDIDIYCIYKRSRYNFLIAGVASLSFFNEFPLGVLSLVTFSDFPRSFLNVVSLEG